MLGKEDEESDHVTRAPCCRARDRNKSDYYDDAGHKAISMAGTANWISVNPLARMTTNVGRDKVMGVVAFDSWIVTFDTAGRFWQVDNQRISSWLY